MTRGAGIAGSREGIEAIAQPTWRALRGSPSKRAMAPYVMTQPRGTSTTMAYTLSPNICSNVWMARPEYLEINCKSAINRVQGMPYLKWSLNPYGGCVHKCRFCFAVQYRVVADQGTQQDFGTRLFIKKNMLEVLARELRRPGLQGEHITLGTATDPYQPV